MSGADPAIQDGLGDDGGVVRRNLAVDEKREWVPGQFERVNGQSDMPRIPRKGSFTSAARGGTTANWAIARPPGQTNRPATCDRLHSKGSDAATVMVAAVPAA